MLITYLNRIAWFVGLVLIQVLVLNNIHIAGYATPFLYIYLILSFDSSMSRNEMMLWGLALGLSVDTFTNTPGVNASATVLLAFIRPSCLKLFAPRDVDVITPSVKSLGFASFLKYLILTVLIHHTALFTVSFFSIFDIKVVLLESLSSMLVTVATILAVDMIRR